MATPYIPPSDGGFADWLLNFATLIAADPTAYGLVTGDATAISAQNTAYQAAYTAATDPTTRTSVTVAAKDNAKVAALAVVRPYAQQINANAAVTDDQRTALGLTVRKTVPTPIPEPTAVPVLTLDMLTPLQAKIQARNSETPTSKAKPYGATAVEIFQSVGETFATDPDQCSFVNGFSKTPITLDFLAGQVGKKCTLFARYTTKGSYGGAALKGPWSSPLTFNVA